MEPQHSRHKHIKRGGHKVTRKFSTWAFSLVVLLAGAAYASAQEAPVPPAPPSPLEAPQTFVLNDGAPHLGVTLDDVTAEQAQELKLPFVGGALVKNVERDSAAEKAGLEPGDVIVEFDGVRVRSAAEMRRLLRETPSGRTVAIRIVRDGKTRVLSAQLTASNNPFNFNVPEMHMHQFRGEEIPPAYGPHHVTLGISADDLTPQLAQYFGVKGGKGVLITAVTRGGPADKAGLKAGDVIVQLNGKPVSGVDDLRFRLNLFLDDTHKVSITIVRDRHEQTMHADLARFNIWEQQTSHAIAPNDDLVMPGLRAQAEQEGVNASELRAPAERALVQAEVSKQQQYLDSEWQHQLQEQVQALREQFQQMQTPPIILHQNNNEI